MKRALNLVLVALLTLGVTRSSLAQAPAPPVAPASVKAASRESADKAYAEKSYARAIEIYRALKAAGNVRDPEEIDFRIATALFKTAKWDEAIAAAEAGTKTATWKARWYYLLGEIYVKAPKNAWKLGDKVWRQDEYPEAEGDQKPQQVWLGESDQKAALINLETAKTRAQQERALGIIADIQGPTYQLGFPEEIDLNFDLAAFLPQVQFEAFTTALKDRKDTNFDEVIDPRASYATGWSLPKKVLTLYAEIRVLDASKDKADAARSLLAEGLFVRAYRERMDGWAQRYDQEKKAYYKVAYPFDDREAIPVWRRVVSEFPDSPLAPQTLVRIAQEYRNRNDLVKALATYREVEQKYAKTKWISGAKANISDILSKQVNFNLAAPTRPGQQPALNVYSRNVSEVRFAAYKVKLEDYLTPAARLNDSKTSFTSWAPNFGSIAEATKKFGPPAFNWNFKTSDKGDYQASSGAIKAPFTEIGAYAIVASAGGRQYAQVVIISDLALLKKTDTDGSFVYVADARTGAPIPGAHVVMKEWNWNSNPVQITVAQGLSDDGGFFDKKHGNTGSSQVSSFAWVGNRYALTGQNGGSWSSNSQEQGRVLGTTDRPVYRPGQKVNFRQIVTRRVAGGDWQPATGLKVDVKASNAKGEEIYSEALTTNEFGSVSGSFALSADIPLGVCYLSVRSGDNIGGGTQFRVEEYKRPEFEVSVSAPQEAKRPGETVAARINAKYYFGAPVPNARVKYTVRRNVWWASYHFPSPYDWLYSAWNVGYYDTGRRNIGGEGSGAIVAQGETKTDAKGFAELSFQTKADDDVVPQDGWWSYYSNPLYTIEAEVTDTSRRTIEAQGAVKVARQEYFAFLDAQRGFFQKGDRARIEVRTQDANDQPKAAAGKMVVYRQLPGQDEKGRPLEEKVFEEAIATDATGRAVWQWEAKEAGQFRVAYEALDAWGKKVEASQEVWVVGQDMTRIRLRGVTLLLDKKAYEQGDVLRLAIVADKPGAKVLLTQEASGDILRRDVISIEGQSRTIEIPITKAQVPNFFLGAALVQDFEVYQAQTEVFVPPARQMLDISVKGDKATYKPGETGTFQVSAKDWSGQPARAEVSLALVDASLFYIQKSYTPDVRQFLYGDRRYNSVSLDSSRSGTPEPQSEGPSPPPYERHGLELPDDLGQLQLPPDGFGYYYGGFLRHRAGYSSYLSDDNDSALEGRVTALENRVGAAPMAPLAASVALAGFGGGTPPAEAPVQVRSNFAETAYWSPSVVTEGGQATLKVTFPDSLTQWHASALGLTQSVQVGQAESDVATKKDLLVRLQAPRFFVERDKVVLSANVHNYSDKAQSIRVVFNTSSLLKAASGAAPTQTIQLGAGEETRLDLPVEVTGEGEANVQVTAQSATDSDGMKLSFPVLVHGAPRFAAQSGLLKGDGKATIALNFPKERRFGASNLNVQLNPSLAATMLDALPYLSDYPYGCVEQTMSRFLPSVIAERTLRESGINLAQLRARAKAYEDESKAVTPSSRVKNTGYTFPKGQPNSRDLTEMASQRWWSGRSTNNPIFDADQMKRMVDEGLTRLYSMQRGDGGWGWFAGAPESDPYMSAYVFYGLAQAEKAGVEVRGGVLNRAADYLNRQMVNQDNIHLLTYLAYALSERSKLSGDTLKIASGRLFEQRERLTAYSKSLLALSLWNSGDQEKAGVLVRNLENTALVDKGNGTAHWKMASQWWCWWNNDVETNALALRAFDTIDPDNTLTPLLMKWLTLQGRGNHWRSTKETAEVVYSLAGYVMRHHELDVDYTLKVSLNGKLARTYRVTRDNALFFDNRFVTGELFLENGANTLTIEKQGRGNLYWNAYSEYFSLEEPLKASGNELQVQRRFFKLTRKIAEEPKTETPADPAVAVDADAQLRPRRGGIIRPIPVPEPQAPEYDRAEIKDGASLKSGDLVEVELVVDAKNAYEYLLFEDMKAAGLEPVEVRSGYDYADGLSYYVEMRDDKVAFFLSDLPQGRRVLRYRLRAEVPGTFHALPTNGYALYAPDVRATSDEMRVGVQD